MKLTDWLQQEGLSRVAFARRIGLSPAAVTALCNNDAVWMSRDTAALISRETGGAVTPNDFHRASGGCKAGAFIDPQPRGEDRAAIRDPRHRGAPQRRDHHRHGRR
jgi:transcriptional regulator with XRE-family HTH domain